MSSRLHLGRTLAAALFLMSFHASGISVMPGGGNTSAVRVECTKASALIQINIQNHRKIGNVDLVVRDENDRSLYTEHGKASTKELVRKLDKSAFPKGVHTLTVTAKDFTISQVLVIE